MHKTHAHTYTHTWADICAQNTSEFMPKNKSMPQKSLLQFCILESVIFCDKTKYWNQSNLLNLFVLLGFEVFTAVILKSIIFWDMTPCNPLSFKTYVCLLVFAELISSTLKMEAICSSETSIETQRTTRRHIPEDDTLLWSWFIKQHFQCISESIVSNDIVTCTLVYDRC
jgi:hypothetical protein